MNTSLFMYRKLILLIVVLYLQINEEELANLLRGIPSIKTHPELPCQAVLDAINSLELKFVTAGIYSPLYHFC